MQLERERKPNNRSQRSECRLGKASRPDAVKAKIKSTRVALKIVQVDALIQGFPGAFAGWAAVEQGYLANRVLECIRDQVVWAARRMEANNSNSAMLKE